MSDSKPAPVPNDSSPCSDRAAADGQAKGLEWAINGRTRLLGVIGDPVVHSLSPAMHNLALEALGIDARYLAFHIRPERLAEAARGFAAMGMIGFNATIPHKEALVELVDQLDPEARMLGAVNTVAVSEAGRLTGYNTDAYGFAAALQAAFPGCVAGAQALVLGAGGAARAVVAGLAGAGAASIVIANRTPERAESLAADLTAAGLTGAPLTPAPLEAARLPLESCDLLINTTSMGLHGEAIPGVDLARLPGHAIVNDIVYAPPVTPLMEAALDRGLRALNGLDMLIHQGARAFAIWTGEEMPTARVKRHLQGLLAPD